jgi:hypothetical protein
MSPRTLLAVAHEVTLTGSPMNLLHLLRWVREHTDTRVETLVLRDGILRHRFEELGPVHLLDHGAVTALLGTVQAGPGSRWRRPACCPSSASSTGSTWCT